MCKMKYERNSTPFCQRWVINDRVEGSVLRRIIFLCLRFSFVMREKLFARSSGHCIYNLDYFNISATVYRVSSSQYNLIIRIWY